ncbi:ABC-2 type transporter [Dictyocaulus viviparus]|uniref:ABC-2 type transporter n=1 Tax=Dictyocaulus viviparus TaxID=29172 RepID=A0A0D8XZH2_DICVI|nr:ABC-2 type transporter [Dictyocaulus viviparus]
MYIPFIEYIKLPWRTTGKRGGTYCSAPEHCLDNLRNPALARAKFIQKVVMGLFIGLLYFKTPLTIVGIGNLNGALFYIVCELTYTTLFGILACLPSDHPLVMREYHDGLYSVISYYLARVLSYVPLFSTDGLVMLYVCYWMVGFSSSLSQVLLASLISFLTEQSATACGVMLGSILPSYPNRDEVLSQFSFKAEQFTTDLLLITAFIFVFYLFGYIGLLIRVYRAR